MAARGTAAQRRDRRLRSFCRHEQLSIAMAVAAAFFHSANRTWLPKTGVVESVQQAVELERAEMIQIIFHERILDAR